METGLYHQIERLRKDPASEFYPGNKHSSLAAYFLNLGRAFRSLVPQQPHRLLIDSHSGIHYPISNGIEEIVPLSLLVGLACVELKLAADNSLDSLLEYPVTVLVGEQDHNDRRPDGRIDVFSQDGAYYGGSDNLMYDPTTIVPHLVEMIKRRSQGSAIPLVHGNDLFKIYLRTQLTRNPEAGIIVHTFGERLDLGVAYEKIPHFQGYLTLEQQVGEDGRQIHVLISDPQDQANVRAALESEKQHLKSKRGQYRLVVEEADARKPYAFVDGAFYGCGSAVISNVLKGRQAFVHRFGQKIDPMQFKKGR